MIKFAKVQLTEQEIQKLWLHFAIYIEQAETAEHKFDNDTEVYPWFENYKAHFKNLKQIFCESHDNPDAIWDTLDEQIQKFDGAFIWHLRPVHMIAESLIQQKIDLEALGEQTETKIDVLNAHNANLQQRIGEVTLNSTTESEMQSSLEGRAKLKSINYQKQQLTQELNANQLKIKGHEATQALIADGEKYVTSLQLYLAETKNLEKPEDYAEHVFSQTHFLVTQGNLEKNWRAEKPKEASADDKVIQFASTEQGELYSKLNLLKTAAQRLEAAAADERLMVDLYLAQRFQTKYTTMSEIIKTQKLIQELPEKIAEKAETISKNQALEQSEPIKFNNLKLEHAQLIKKLADAKALLPALQESLIAVNETLQDHSEYITQLLVEGKAKLQPLWEEKLAKLKAKLTEPVLSDEEIAKLEVGSEVRFQAMENATLPAKIKSVDNNLQMLKALQPETLDHNALTVDQLTVCTLIVEEMKNTPENIAAYDAIVNKYKESSVIQTTTVEKKRRSTISGPAKSTEVEEESGINLSKITGVYKKELEQVPDLKKKKKAEPEKKKNIYLKNFGGGVSHNLLKYLAENNQAHVLYLPELNKKTRNLTTAHTMAYTAAMDAYWTLQNKFKQMQTEITAINVDFEEKNQRMLANLQEKVKPNQVEKDLTLEKRTLAVEERAQLIEQEVRTLLNAFSKEFNIAFLQDEFAKLSKQQLLQVVSRALFTTGSVWREHLQFGIEHPVNELLYMLGKHLEQDLIAPAQATITARNVKLESSQTILPRTIVWLKSYILLHYDNESKKTGEALLQKAETLLKKIGENLKKKNNHDKLLKRYGELSELVYDLHEYKSKENLKPLPAKESLKVEHYFAVHEILKQLANVQTQWVDNHAKCPIYALTKLRAEIEKLANLIKEHDEGFASTLKNAYSAKIDKLMKDVHTLYGRDPTEIARLTDLYNNNARPGRTRSNTVNGGSHDKEIITRSNFNHGQTSLIAPRPLSGINTVTSASLVSFTEHKKTSEEQSKKGSYRKTVLGIFTSSPSGSSSTNPNVAQTSPVPTSVPTPTNGQLLQPPTKDEQILSSS